MIERAKLVTLHTVGAAIAAVKTDAGKNIIDITKSLGSGGREATIIGDGAKAGISNALLSNGTLADLLDWYPLGLRWQKHIIRAEKNI